MTKIEFQVADGRRVELRKDGEEVKVVEYHNCLEDGEFCGMVTWTASAEELHDLFAMHLRYLACSKSMTE